MRYLILDDDLYHFICYDKQEMVDVYVKHTSTAIAIKRVEHGTPALTHDQILNTHPELLL